MRRAAVVGFGAQLVENILFSEDAEKTAPQTDHQLAGSPSRLQGAVQSPVPADRII